MKRKTLLIAIFLIFITAQLSCGLVGGGQTAPAAEQAAREEIQTDVIAAPKELTTPLVVAPSLTPTQGQPEERQEPAVPYGQHARRWLEEIVGQFGARPAGSEAESKAADYIAGQLKEMGYFVERQPFSFDGGRGKTIHSANIIAVKKGLSDREIIVGAHYDSGDEGEGADDNASGVAVLLETAWRIIDLQTPFTIRFIAFGAEENGLIGSNHYVRSLPKMDLENIVYMVNLDSLIAGEIAYIYGDAGFKGSLRDKVLKESRRLGISLEGKTAEELDPPHDPCECSDYFPFKKAGIPYIYFESTNWNLGDQDGWTQVDEDLGDNGMIWHTPYDTIAYIDRIAPERINERLETFTALLVDALMEYEE